MPGDDLIQKGKELCEGLGNGTQLAVQDRLNEAVDLINSRKFNDVFSAFNSNHQDLHLSKVSFVKETYPSSILGLATSLGVRAFANPTMLNDNLSKITGKKPELPEFLKDENVQNAGNLAKEFGISVFDSAIQMPLIEIAKMVNHADSADRIKEKLTMLKPSDAAFGSEVANTQLVGHVAGFFVPATAAFKIVGWGGKALGAIGTSKYILAVPGVTALLANPAVQQNLQKAKPILDKAGSVLDITKPLQQSIAAAATVGYFAPVADNSNKQWQDRLVNAGIAGATTLFGGKIYQCLGGGNKLGFLEQTGRLAISGAPAGLAGAEMLGIKAGRPILSKEEYLTAAATGIISAPFLSLTVGRALNAGAKESCKQATGNKTVNERINLLKAAQQRHEAANASKNPEAREQFKLRLEDKAVKSLQEAKEQKAQDLAQTQKASQKPFRALVGDQDINQMDPMAQEMIKGTYATQNQVVRVGDIEQAPKQEIVPVEPKQTIFNPARINHGGGKVKDGQEVRQLPPMADSHLGNAGTLDRTLRLLPRVVTKAGDANSTQVIPFKDRVRAVIRPKTYNLDGSGQSGEKAPAYETNPRPVLDSDGSQKVQSLVNKSVPRTIRGKALDGSTIGEFKIEPRFQSEHNCHQLIKTFYRERRQPYQSETGQDLKQDSHDLTNKIHSGTPDTVKVQRYSTAPTPAKEIVNPNDTFRTVNAIDAGVKSENPSPKSTGHNIKGLKNKESDQ